MKKWILLALLFLVAALVSIFIFIPTEISVATDKKVYCPAAAINRLFENKLAIKKWWPGEMINDTVYTFQKNRYLIPKSISDNLTIQVTLENLTITGEISSLLLYKDTAAVECRYLPFTSGLNPLLRFNNYLKALTLKKQTNTILESIKTFAENTENIYGYKIIQSKVKDSSLISTSKSFATYPTNEEVGKLIDKLKSYLKVNGGEENDAPMLNINQTAANNFDVMVAIPLVKDIPVRGDIIIKKMILGNILEAKVTGGKARIQRCEEALKYFMLDYNKSSPAIPFQTLVTDRVAIKDSALWVTYVKYPVF